MLDLTVVVLTGNEALHIKRCLDRIVALESKKILIVDSYSCDDTKSIVESFRTTHANYIQSISFIKHKWPGNQAAQFNWAMDNITINTKWILRLDADEYLTDELIAEIRNRLPLIEDGVDGVILKRRHVVGWLGSRWIKHGMYPTHILRLFRKGQARYAEDMDMDEHLVINGRTIEFDNDFVDESLISFEEWKAKHCIYAKREARMAVSGKANANKRFYYRLPPYLRAFLYFSYRYFLRLGFLDGYAGWMWHFWQGLWYRCLVDREIRDLTKRVSDKRST